LENYQNSKTDNKYKLIDENGDNNNKIARQKNHQNSSFDGEMYLSEKEKTLFNPLKMFQLIRNFVVTLPKFEKELHQDHERSE
jgi:hypothetical protein